MSAEALEALQRELERFAAERDWQQFHSPKNLSMALAVEASEVVEHFQWLTEKESEALAPERLEKVRLELADVFIYLLRLADRLGVDLLAAAASTGIPAFAASSVGQAIDLALEHAEERPDIPIVVSGSVYLVGDVRTRLLARQAQSTPPASPPERVGQMP